METINNDNPQQIEISEEKERKHEENWEEYDSEEEQLEKQKQSEVVYQPKRIVLKDKHGEIIINKLDTYVEPHKIVKEARGRERLQNNYNFGDLSFDEEEESDEEGAIAEKLNESEDDNAQAAISEKKKKKKVEGKETDLDELLKEFGVEVKSEAGRIDLPRKQKPRVEKESAEKTENVKVDGEKIPEIKTAEDESQKKKVKKTKPAAGEKTKKPSHMSELKREILERKEALKKKEKKKGI